jgi:dynein heavy chain 2
MPQGMALGYGGNPYGPAGTGKTESVKALGQAMARQVLVFNCDEQFDFKSMGRIFVGLVKCGAWGCFDEFNRLDEEVLSAVSQQIQQIQGAIKEHTASIEFMGQQVKVDFNAGIFVTLNPAGKGYGGRSKLPDNLKQLFRSVAMSVPNNELIAEVMLLSEGIKAARDIGRKTVSLFNLSKQLLSPQQHYDWGLRALKTVLGIAGRLLQERRAASGGALSPEEETDLVLQAVKVTTLPKLTYGDNKRFLSLLADVFPGAAHSNTNDPAVEDAIRKAMEEMQLEPLPAQVEKVLQLHLACVQRIGIIIVGPSGAGKSTLWRILEAAYRHMSRPVKTHIMNPKAMHRQRLLGHMDMDTREMFDGVLTAASRQVVKEPLEQHSWIICDGDVDPEWIESLNSVLDDNRLLTLPSGERIQFASNINFIFECHSLEFASPATVSRCGMLYLSEENIDVDRILSAWIKRQPDAQQANLTTWIDEYFLKALEWAEGQPQAVESSKLGMVNSCLSQVRNSGTKHEFCVGLAKGLGANMEPKVREELLTFLARLTSEGDLLATQPGASIQSIVRGEDDDGVGVPSTGKLIVTRDTLINASLIAAWLRRGEPLLLVGPEVPAPAPAPAPTLRTFLA